ncbi:Di-copper centre-containing protein [Clavulina sp. PMI_390]|nr:Di-copper centre-containing protein [Clavulina sp. PMI_390]
MSAAQNQHYAITGIQVGLDPKNPLEPKPLRREVDEWLLLSESDPHVKKQVNLFFVAMDEFQKMPITDTLSYWQVAGIHGQPLVPWDEKTESQTFGIGYCFHNSLLFPTWHRPYMLLFEQRVYEIMLKHAKKFPSTVRDEWIAAANSWRLPYWDWAEKKSRDVVNPDNKIYDAPLIVKQDVVQVEIGQGEEPPLIKQISNPMATFKTPDGLRMGSAEYGKLGIQPVTYCGQDGACETYYFNICTATSRHPPAYDPKDPETVKAWSTGVQNNDDIAQALYDHDWYESGPKKTYTDTLGEAVYHLFGENNFTGYAAFASTRYLEQKQLPPAEYLSLEDIHNNIHGWTGGNDGGHMSIVPVAAFDPIFYLHHANIDRLLAIWQELNEDVWFSKPEEQLTEQRGNWSLPKGATNTPQTPLAPFRGVDGKYYDSDSTRHWSEAGYAYPELQPWKFLDATGQVDKERYHSSIRERLSNLYATNRKIVLAKAESSNHPGWQIETEKGTGAMFARNPDYIANIRYERYALDGRPFSIHVILGDKYHAGSVYNFCTPAETTGNDPVGCENCRQQALEGAMQKGQINITNALLTAADDGVEELIGLDDDKVKNWLRENLRWRILTTGYKEIDVESIPSFKGYVARGNAHHYRDESILSTYKDYEILTEITEGRPGGIGANDLH